ncbi:transposase [Sphingomonas sp. RHCKR7]|uniref:exonuclease domain-containing protein n=1 Tax=Sphingomonas folli TaxID=2862497 RepID=UPI001CA4DBBF|nr:exonuclease domain-containing protein [Sphingomonas folli]MBW6526366.1 transposase [Sphingomonas folli]
MHADPTASLPPVDFVAVDVETACARVSSICQIGVVGFKDGAEVFAWQSLIDPRDEFAPSNMRVHGISCDHVVGQPSFADAHAAIAACLAGRTVVAHSLFDKGAIAAACRAHDLPPIECTWLDSVRVAKRAWPELPSHRLNLLARHLRLRHKHHDALSDARVAGMVVVKATAHTGIDLAGWLAPAAQRGRAAPRAASAGPLAGQRVAILGAARDGTLAHRLAAQGARITAAVGATSHLLVISSTQPFGRFVHAHAEYRRAEELRLMGRSIEIVTEDELLARLAGA